MRYAKRLFILALAIIVTGSMLAVPCYALGATWQADFAQFPMLSLGSTYDGYTRALQRFLYCYPSTKTTIINGGGVDGSFGPATKNAVTTYQIAEWPYDKDEWDGVVGSGTWGRIAIRLSADWLSHHVDLLYGSSQVIYVDTRAEGYAYYNYNCDITGTVYVDKHFYDR